MRGPAFHQLSAGGTSGHAAAGNARPGGRRARRHACPCHTSSRDAIPGSACSCDTCSLITLAAINDQGNPLTRRH